MVGDTVVTGFVQVHVRRDGVKDAGLCCRNSNDRLGLLWNFEHVNEEDRSDEESLYCYHDPE